MAWDILLFITFCFLWSHFQPLISAPCLSHGLLPPSPNTAQRHRQLRQLVNPDKEPKSTSHFDIYRVIFTTSLYNLFPFISFLYFAPSRARKLDGNFYMSSLTEGGHRGQSQQFGMYVDVRSEVFKAGHAAVINIAADTNALWIPQRPHSAWDFIGPCSVLFALLHLNVCVCVSVRGWEREKEIQSEKERQGDLHMYRVTG